MSNLESHIKKCHDNLIDKPIMQIIIFAMTCIERQWKFYEKGCDDLGWNDPKNCRKVLDKIWTFIEKKSDITEDDAEECLREIPNEIPNDTINMSITVLENISYLIDGILGKDKELLIDIARYNFDFIDAYIYSTNNFDVSNENDQYIQNHKLILQEIENQNSSLEFIDKYNDDIELIEKCKNRKYRSIID